MFEIMYRQFYEIPQEKRILSVWKGNLKKLCSFLCDFDFFNQTTRSKFQVFLLLSENFALTSSNRDVIVVYQIENVYQKKVENIPMKNLYQCGIFYHLSLPFLVLATL